MNKSNNQPNKRQRKTFGIIGIMFMVTMMAISGAKPMNVDAHCPMINPVDPHECPRLFPHDHFNIRAPDSINDFKDAQLLELRK
ncbi:MAG: hypothetical protein R2685_15620 [Candidatus Nitrosocosmicus sp.]|nr:hypothetical protein [Candidatus Nitrosocosmicus sp.]